MPLPRGHWCALSVPVMSWEGLNARLRAPEPVPGLGEVKRALDWGLETWVIAVGEQGLTGSICESLSCLRLTANEVLCKLSWAV